VIAFRAGGAVETVVENVTGLFFDEPTSVSLADAIERFERQSWDSLALQAHASKFDRAVFGERLLAFLREVAPPADLAEQGVWESFPQLEVAAPSFTGLRPAGN